MGGEAGGDGMTLCERVCANAASANCSNMSTCIYDCLTEWYRPGCESDVSAYWECISKAPPSTFSCSSENKPQFHADRGYCATELHFVLVCHGFE
jgi:hypothetical protein